MRELAAVVTKFPQVLENVRVARREALADADRFWTAVRAAETELGADGCWSDPPGPSRSYGSWSRPATRPPPVGSPTASPTCSTPSSAEAASMPVVVRVTDLAARDDVVWARVTTPAGVNDDRRFGPA